MRRPSGLRRIAKWAGVGICTLIALVWLLSGWWNITYVRRPGKVFSITAGSLCYVEVNEFFWLLRNHRELYELAPRLYALSPRNRQWRWQWAPYSYIVIGQRIWFFVACWIPFLLVSLPTVILFVRDRGRRVLPGQCQECGYDLTGNVSGVCPECGKGM